MWIWLVIANLQNSHNLNDNNCDKCLPLGLMACTAALSFHLDVFEIPLSWQRAQPMHLNLVCVVCGAAGDKCSIAGAWVEQYVD